jgi:histidyl-tRNA synthetase
VVAVEPRLLKGFRDFLPAEQAGRQKMLDAITVAFESCGFAPLSTPAIEYADILLGKYGDEGEKLLYRFQDNGGRDVALRYDLTVPLARVVAQYRDLPRPFRRYQTGTVWRAEKPAHGRFREFMQYDADIVGSASPLADADCIAAGVLALEGLGLDRFVVRIGHRGVLNALLAAAGVQDGKVQAEVLRAIDKIEKIGIDAVRDILASLEPVGHERAGVLLKLLGDADDPSFLTSNATDQLCPDGVAHLRTVFGALDAMGLGRRVSLDLRIARGLDYYTGTVYETTLLDLPSVGSVMSGGRYDTLLETYGVPAIPCVGISIGVDRLFAALVELGTAPTGATGPQAVVCILGDAAFAAGMKLVSDLRRAGLRAESVPEPSARLKKQFEYAARRKARFALLLGDAEVAEGRVTVKDLESGQQTQVAFADLAASLISAISKG